MISKNHGYIITIASGAGLFGTSGMMDYSASKFGAVGIHESLTMELYSLGCTGVRTTCVCPYFINTGMFDGVQTRYWSLQPSSLYSLLLSLSLSLFLSPLPPSLPSSLSWCRFPWLLPILSPEYAVKKIMQAYHSNQVSLFMPRILYTFYFLQS